MKDEKDNTFIKIDEEELRQISGGVDETRPASKYYAGQRVKIKSPHAELEPVIEGILINVSNQYMPSRGYACLVGYQFNGEAKRVALYEREIISAC